MSSVHEAAFEAHIAGWLAKHGGYGPGKHSAAGGESDFDPVAGMDTADLFEFIDATQRERWDQLVKRRVRRPPCSGEGGFREAVWRRSSMGGGRWMCCGGGWWIGM